MIIDPNLITLTIASLAQLMPSSESKADAGSTLHLWVARQRNLKDKLPMDKRRKLDDLGFVWSPFEWKWRKGFESLKRYKLQNGDFEVPYKYIDEDGFKLGVWVHSQRDKRRPPNKERMDLLKKIGFK